MKKQEKLPNLFERASYNYIRKLQTGKRRSVRTLKEMLVWQFVVMCVQHVTYDMIGKEIDRICTK